jgi:hypothetical protein
MIGHTKERFSATQGLQRESPPRMLPASNVDVVVVSHNTLQQRERSIWKPNSFDALSVQVRLTWLAEGAVLASPLGAAGNGLGVGVAEGVKVGVGVGVVWGYRPV